MGSVFSVTSSNTAASSRRDTTSPEEIENVGIDTQDVTVLDA
jgi:hypothetical protein